VLWATFVQLVTPARIVAYKKRFSPIRNRSMTKRYAAGLWGFWDRSRARNSSVRPSWRGSFFAGDVAKAQHIGDVEGLECPRRNRRSGSFADDRGGIIASESSTAHSRGSKGPVAVSQRTLRRLISATSGCGRSAAAIADSATPRGERRLHHV
jgi:hypothetical protein